jgi:hypothetical protein
MVDVACRQTLAGSERSERGDIDSQHLSRANGSIPSFLSEKLPIRFRPISVGAIGPDDA